MKFKNITLIAALMFSVVALYSCGEEKETEEATESGTTSVEPAAKGDTEPIVEEEVVDSTVVPDEAPEEEPVVEEVETTSAPVKAAPVKKEPVVKEAAPVVEAKVEEVQEKPAGAAKMDFEEWEFKFDEINQGDVVEHTFNFTNVGDAPLIISNARASCGCTVPEWPKEAIAPGAKSQVHVKFNSRGKRGMQNKSVTITTNYGKEVVYLKGNVKVPETTTPAQGE